MLTLNHVTAMPKITSHCIDRFIERISRADRNYLPELFENLLNSPMINSERYVMLYDGQPEDRDFIRGKYQGKNYYLVIDPWHNVIKTVYDETIMKSIRNDARIYSRIRQENIS